MVQRSEKQGVKINWMPRRLRRLKLRVCLSMNSDNHMETLRLHLTLPLELFHNLQQYVMNTVPPSTAGQGVAAVCFPFTLPAQQHSSDGSNLMGSNDRTGKMVQSDPQTISPAGTSQGGGSSVIGKKCKLLHWFGNEQVVAEAEINCTDPMATVHQMILGPDSWRVCVKKVLVSNVPLYRPSSEFHSLDDALGSFVAWPTKYITY